MTDHEANVSLSVDAAGVAIVQISQPRKRNALTAAMWQQLRETFLKISTDSSIRCVVMRGAGQHFSAGADISEFGSVRTGIEASERYEAVIDSAICLIRECSKPVIAAISGAAVGGGLSVALACDFRIADKTARVGVPAAKLGIVYGLLDCSILAERIGITNAKLVLFTGRIFGADDARTLNIIDVVDEKDAFSSAIALAQEITGNAPLSIAGSKAILNAVGSDNLSQDKTRLEELIRTAINSADYSEGVAAFQQRRRPAFQGI